MTTYVYDGIEVKKTGRTAVKTINLTGNKTRELTLFEITPIADFEWKKWVPPEQLYEVK